MVSTHVSDDYPYIPKQELVAALREKPTRVALSNPPPARPVWPLPEGFRQRDEFTVETTIPV